MLFQKIYSTPYGIVHYWITPSDSDYRLEIIIDEEDYAVNPSKIIKSLSITSTELEIAEQMVIKLHKTGAFNKHNVNTVNFQH